MNALLRTIFSFMLIVTISVMDGVVERVRAFFGRKTFYARLVVNSIPNVFVAFGVVDEISRPPIILNCITYRTALGAMASS
jgi:hypothetical protein